MKKIKTILGVVALMVIASTSSVKAENYVINDNAVEAVFASSEAVPVSLDYVNEISSSIPSNEAKVSGSANAWAAFALCTFLGQLGIHRFYLGTATFTGIGYILTCGGIFGLVPFVDWIVLLVGAISKDISKYEDNTKFFMW
jgi:TM2 domain-containing membrane protein YozV